VTFTHEKPEHYWYAILMKTCSKCKTAKDYTQFNKNRTKKDGYAHYCRVCTRLTFSNRDKNWCNKRNKQYRNKVWSDICSKLDKIKAVGCSLCDEKDVCCLDFHHLDPSTKTYTICVMLHDCFSWKRIIKEINKCVILCSNCHRKLHKYNWTLDEKYLCKIEIKEEI